MLLRDQFYIAGRWTTPTTHDAIDVHEAATGAVMGKVPAGSERDIAAAVAAARAAFDGWSQRPAAERAGYLAKIAAGLKQRADDLARLIAREVGMPLKLAGRIQAGLPIMTFGNYAKLVTEFAFEERVGNSLVVREPVGVVGAITPWNYPLHQIALKVAPALAAGCTVVVKPSEIAPFNAFVLAEVMHEAGVPPGVFNLVTGLGPVVGEALVRHPDEADLHSDLGFAYRNLRDLDRAFVHYRRALALDPRHRGAHEYIGEAYLMAGDLASAEKHVAALRAICLLPCEELKDLEEAVGGYRAAKGLRSAPRP